jgi:hypothetical protein
MAKREVKERLRSHNLRINHVVIQLELRYWFGAKVAWPGKWNHDHSLILTKSLSIISGPDNNPAKKIVRRILDGFGTEQNHFSGPNADSWQVCRTNCQHYTGLKSILLGRSSEPTHYHSSHHTFFETDEYRHSNQQVYYKTTCPCVQRH